MEHKFYTHYIEIDDNNNIVKGFSTAFEKRTDKSILFTRATQSRHFVMFNEENHCLIDSNGFYKYKYIDNEVVIKSDDDLQKELEFVIGNTNVADNLHNIIINEKRIAEIFAGHFQQIHKNLVETWYFDNQENTLIFNCYPNAKEVADVFAYASLKSINEHFNTNIKLIVNIIS